MTKFGRRSIYLLVGAMALAACTGVEDEQGRPRPTAADLVQIERITAEPLVGGTVTPFAPPPLSMPAGEEDEAPQTPTPPATPGQSPTPVTPEPGDAAPDVVQPAQAAVEEAANEEPTPAEQEEGTDGGQAAGQVPVQIEVVFGAPETSDSSSGARSVPLQITVVVEPSIAGDQEDAGVSAGARAQPEERPSSAEAQDGSEMAEAEGVEVEDDADNAESEAGGSDVQAAASQQGVGSADDVQDFIGAGKHVYQQRCAACHGSTGTGRRDFFPDLRDNRILTVEDPDGLIGIVLHGRGLMPPFRSHLSDDEIAAAISFLRTTWGNDADLVMPEDVDRVRRSRAQHPR
jgi:mono/diheme cytochrome c family protein